MKITQNEYETILKIAKKELNLKTLKSQGSDELDFFEVSAWAIEDILIQAFIAGRKAVKKETIKKIRPTARDKMLGILRRTKATSFDELRKVTGLPDFSIEQLLMKIENEQYDEILVSAEKEGEWRYRLISSLDDKYWVERHLWDE